MTAFEYSVIPAPERGEKTKGAKTASERFSRTLTAELNRMAADGWEYLRAEILPSEERSGLTGRSTVYHNMLVFRRALGAINGAALEPAGQAVQPFTQPMQAVARPQAEQATSEGKEQVQPKPTSGVTAGDHIAADAPAD